jgi:hypothetical protein
MDPLLLQLANQRCEEKNVGAVVKVHPNDRVTLGRLHDCDSMRSGVNETGNDENPKGGI